MEREEARTRCPDCHSCQVCSKSRCRLCREGRHEAKVPWVLGTGFTYGRYLEWRKQQDEQGALH